ncbi:MAG: DNA-3-methyladenine glycosylase 2 family protein [Clostridiales bacterium]|nr:DNA-3-methyladenine glycosylase 2 family protein [Clostridiales bacterium]
MFVKSDENKVEIKNTEINLDVTLDCGQAFRWRKNNDGSWTGVVRGKEATVAKTDTGLIFKGVSDEDFADIFYRYFDLDRDYDSVLKRISGDETLRLAAEKYGVIRILNQEPWETLCSFIISACNNIPRIKGIIERLCQSFGDKAGGSYSFPSAERLAELSPSELEVLRAGFRAPYICDGAKKVAQGEIDLDSLCGLPLEAAEKELMKIKGVGKKVADCTLLFGLGHTDAFPVDRHIKRFCDKLYPEGLPDCIRGIEGIAQQYMFCLQRWGAEIQYE